jgi:hypothetical protein
MILLTDRPPQPETPPRYFLEDFTPNEALYLRWHFAGNPTEVNAAEWRLDGTAPVNRRLRLGLDDLRHQFEAVSNGAASGSPIAYPVQEGGVVLICALLCVFSQLTAARSSSSSDCLYGLPAAPGNLRHSLTYP